MDQKEITSTPVTRFLDECGVSYRTFRHPAAVHSLEQAALERGQRLDQIIRSIVFRLSHDGFVMVLVAGEKQISWQALRHHLGTSRISMATEAEVLQVTGYTLGAVSPFGIKQPLRILVDRGVLQEAEISVGSGVRFTAVIMQKEGFLTCPGEGGNGGFCYPNCEDRLNVCQLQDGLAHRNTQLVAKNTIASGK